MTDTGRSGVGVGEGVAPWLPAFGLLLLGAVGAAWSGLRPRGEDGPLAAVFPPWWSAPAAFGAAASADVAVVRTGAWPSLLVVRPTGPDAPSRLRAAGAWFVLDGRAMGGCAPDGRG